MAGEYRNLARAAADWVARRCSFERHLRRMEPATSRLRAAGHDSPNVLGILAVESFYRPRVLRLVEYAYWAVASALGLSVEHLSVGRAQLQLRHWRSLGTLDDTRFSRAALARVRDPEVNYVACERFLERGGMLAEPRATELSTFYAGEPRYAEQLGAAIRAASPSPSAPA